jgi:quinol monooxygenase YgiN
MPILFAQSQTPQTALPETKKKADMKGASDFDFLIGDWSVHHRKLKQRLAQTQEWQEVEGTSSARKILAGLGNMDENVIEAPSGTYRAVTIRTYDPAKQLWSIWWIDSRYPQQHLDPPVVGRFEKGVGTFYADDEFNGKPIRVRYLWTHTPNPHWEQAFSSDGGKTWETNWTMDFTKAVVNGQACCPVAELRQYTLKPDQRDALIDLFEREFIESQEATGMKVIGTFRDLNNPDRFVWLRGFSDMAARAQALQEFYGGPVWKAHRDAANATMIDSDNVLLLRPARSDSGFRLENLKRPPHGSKEDSDALVVATIYHLAGTTSGDFPEFFEREFAPKLKDTGGSMLGTFVTENHPNTFPALPVREGVNVFVSFSLFPNRTTWEQHAAALADLIREKQIAGKLSRLIKEQPEVLLLAPTARSLVR